MATHEAVEANIKCLLETFDNFVNLYEKPTWFKTASTEDTKTAFKTAKFIEDAMENFKEKSCLDAFVNTLNQWWQTKMRTKVYNNDFYNLACDRLLSRFFSSKDIAPSATDVAVRIYTTLFPQERFQSFLTKLILDASSYEAITDYAVTVKDKFNYRELECRLLLNRWAEDCSCGHASSVKDYIKGMFASYKIKTSLPILVGILALNKVTDTEQEIKNLILEQLLPKMLDRSTLSKDFWLAFFQNVEKSDLAKCCKEFRKFSESFLNFVIYIGCMMNSEVGLTETKWVVDRDTSICPELIYEDLLSVVKYLCGFDCDLEKYVRLRVDEAKMFADSLIWTDVERELF